MKTSAIVLLATLVSMTLNSAFAQNSAQERLQKESPAWETISSDVLRDLNFELTGQHVLINMVGITNLVKNKMGGRLGSCQVTLLSLSQRYLGNKPLPLKKNGVYPELEYAAVVRLQNDSGLQRDFILRSNTKASYSIPFSTWISVEQKYNLKLKDISGEFKASTNIKTNAVMSIMAPGFSCVNSNG